MSFQQITPTQLKARLDEGWTPFLLDVRNETEAAIASIPNTDLLQPHTEVDRVVDRLPRDRDIVVICRSGGRSGMACQVLAQHGFDRLFNLAGGVNGWSAQVDPSMQQY